MKILILGGYGTFGGRLAYLLAGEERLTLLIAGRSIQKAKKFCEGLPSGAQKVPVYFDRNANVETQIREINPDMVVDAMGPFQAYGDDPYGVVKACIANEVDYMDLADGSDFVKGIRQFDEEAKAKNIYVLSGVSSFPVLTAAVVRKLSHDMARVTTIKGGIAPSPYAGVGLNVIRAIASYAGKPLSLIRKGKPATGYALTETMRYTICPPGDLPLKNTLFSLVDVPDLKVLPASVSPITANLKFASVEISEVATVPQTLGTPAPHVMPAAARALARAPSSPARARVACADASDASSSTRTWPRRTRSPG